MTIILGLGGLRAPRQRLDDHSCRPANRARLPIQAGGYLWTTPRISSDPHMASNATKPAPRGSLTIIDVLNGRGLLHARPCAAGSRIPGCALSFRNTRSEIRRGCTSSPIALMSSASHDARSRELTCRSQGHLLFSFTVTLASFASPLSLIPQSFLTTN